MHGGIEKTIDIEKILKDKMGGRAKFVPRFAVSWLKHIIHEDEVNQFLWESRGLSGTEWLAECVRYLDMTLQVEGLENLPDKTDGKLYTFVSNHPLGGLDGICLAAFLGARSGEAFRCVVNDLLLFIPNLRSIFLPVNKHGRQRREAAAQLEAAMRGPGQVLTFPAGLCSRRSGGVIADGAWRPSFVREAVRYERDVVPIFFDGRNSDRFYRAARWRERLGIRLNVEMIYLPDEMFRNKHQAFGVYIGAPIAWQTFSDSRRPQEWAAWMRDRVYELKMKTE